MAVHNVGRTRGNLDFDFPLPRGRSGQFLFLELLNVDESRRDDQPQEHHQSGQ